MNKHLFIIQICKLLYIQIDESMNHFDVEKAVVLELLE